MSLPVRFRRNVTSSYAMTVTQAVTALVMTPVLLAGLGTEAFGIWVVVGSLAIYRELLEFGFAKTTPRYVAHYAALKRPLDVRASIATSFWILAVPGAIALLLGIALAAAFPAVFEPSDELAGAAQLLIVIVAIDLAISIPSDAFGGALIGLQRFDLLYGTLIAVAIAQAVGWTLVIILGGGLVPLGIVTVALSLVGQLARFLMVRRLVPGTRLAPRYVDRSLIKPFAGLSFWYALIDVSSIVVIRTDTIVVGAILGVEAAAIYAVGQKLTLAGSQLIKPISSLFFPHSSDLTARQDPARLHDSLVSGTRLVLGIAIPLSIALSVLAGPFIEAWVGAAFGQAATVVVLLAAGSVVSSLTLIGLLMLQGMGEPRRPAMIVAAEALLNLGLSIALAHAIGLAGVALGTLLAAACIKLLVLFPYVCRRFRTSVRSLSGLMLAAHLPPAATTLLVGWLLIALDIGGWLEVIAAGAALVAVYLSVFALSGLDAGERRRIRDHLGGWAVADR